MAEKLLERMDSFFGLRRLLELSEYYFQKTRLAIFRGDLRTASIHAETSLQLIRSALAIGSGQGYLNTFIDQPSVMARLCDAAFSAGIEVEYVQSQSNPG